MACPVALVTGQRAAIVAGDVPAAAVPLPRSITALEALLAERETALAVPEPATMALPESPAATRAAAAAVP